MPWLLSKMHTLFAANIHIRIAMTLLVLGTVDTYLSAVIYTPKQLAKYMYVGYE